MRYRRHVFVCTNDRACRDRGGADIVAALQQAVAADVDAVGTIAVTPCGCLGPCLDGPNAVVYPDGVWLAGIAGTDVPAILAWLRGGALPEHLRYDWPDDDDDQ